MTRSTLLRQLALFNAKERFFLVGYALGNPEFRLGEAFRAALGRAINIAVPDDAYCAMDYHLDWIYAALYASEHGDADVCDNAEEHIKGHQEDVDLLVAFEHDGVTQLVLIEAKAATSWSNDQAGSKTERLTKMFGAEGDRWPRVRPWFVLVSPNAPAKLDLSTWPAWTRGSDGRPIHFQLPVADRKIKRVTRWNAERACADAKGKHWKIVDR